jgi:hypothetical protein
MKSYKIEINLHTKSSSVMTFKNVLAKKKLHTHSSRNEKKWVAHPLVDFRLTEFFMKLKMVILMNFDLKYLGIIYVLNFQQLHYTTK